MEAKLIVLGFENKEQAEGMLNDFQESQTEGDIHLVDAVIASRGSGKEVEIHQTRSDTKQYAAKGSGIGLLAGLLLGGPIGGLIGGAAIGAITGKLKDSGIDDKFIKQVSEYLQPNTAALFILVDEANGPKILENLRPFKARVLTTTLTDEQEKRLEDALKDNEYH